MRMPIESIAAKRNAKTSRIFLTGGTGFTGSFLAVDLMKSGYHVVFLSRPTNKTSALERVENILKWHNYGGDNYEVLSGQITDPHLGLDDGQYRWLLDNTDEIWHCAAETSFSERGRKQSEAVNVRGTVNLLRVAEESRCYFFHFMSTAYVAGKRQGICKEEHEEQTEFHNVYEETKYRAEQSAIEICRDAGIRLNIYRPSIIYGHSETGRSLQFKALYVSAQVIHYLKQYFEKDIEESGGEKASELGVRKNGDGLYMPGRVGMADGGTINLVPIDFTSAQCVAIMENSLEGDVFHIVNQDPNTLDDVVGFLGSFFNTAGLRVVKREEFIEQPETPLEKLAYSFLEVYRPYFSDTRIFENKKSAAIGGRYDIACPRLDYDMFSRCIDYAIKADWGKAAKKAK